MIYKGLAAYLRQCNSLILERTGGLLVQNGFNQPPRRHNRPSVDCYAAGSQCYSAKAFEIVIINFVFPGSKFPQSSPTLL